MRERHYYIYIVTNTARHPLYTGVTNALFHRVDQHAAAEEGTFSKEFRTRRLVYAERYSSIKNAISREKQLKRWTHAKKSALIESINPQWDDMRNHGTLKFGDPWVKGMPYRKKE